MSKGRIEGRRIREIRKSSPGVHEKKVLRPLGAWEKMVMDRLPQDLRRNMEEIRGYESTVLKKLGEDSNLRELFLRQPGEALARMGIPVDPVIRKRVKVSNPEEIFGLREIPLPTGERTNPVVRIEINGISKVKPHYRK